MKSGIFIKTNRATAARSMLLAESRGPISDTFHTKLHDWNSQRSG